MACVAAVAGGASGDVARAEFPWAGTGSPGSSPCTAPSASDFSKLCTASGQPPPDWTGGGNEFKFAATPQDNNTNPLVGSTHPGGGPTGVNNDPMELCGVRGAAVGDNHATYMGGCAYPTSRHVDTAWEYTLGRPDVSIAVLDSGIEWDDAGSMLDLRGKVRLNPGELPVPNHNRAPAVDSPPGTTINCTTYTTRHDANGDGVVNVWDYACDDRVNPGTGGSVSQTYGTPARTMLTPEDLIIAFSKPGSWFGAGKDDDGNGYVNDIAGWDFLDNDNNPYDDVKYGHGTGQAKGSSAEANNGGQTGSCPNCMFLPMRVGDSFIADASRFAQAALYATDNNVDVVQEALGTINNTKLARDAIQYAYDHGVTVIASAADEAAQHHNQVSSLPHTIVVNSVTDYDGTLTPKPQSYLQFNGCTNFSSKVTVAIPSTTCSSNATGMAGGMAGLIYSEAINARDAGKIASTSECRRVNGSRCVITPNEVRQVMASGLLDGSPVADDVNFASPPPGNQPEPVCGSSPAPLCTDPNGALQTQVNANRQNGSPIATTRSYPARKGFDQFYGYGRVNMFNAVRAVANGKLPPEVELAAPDWYDQIDPSKATRDITGHVNARGASYSCRVFVAPGSYPADSAAPAGDFHEVTGALVAGPGPCQGSSRSDAIDGAVAHISIAALKGLFPPTAGSFNGPESGPANPATANGRPNAEPYGFTVKIVATTADTSASASPGDTLQGQDRRNLFLHHDQDLLAGYPRKLPSDGESSPAFADLAGDNRNEMIFGTADGLVHAMRRDGSEVPGWPVKSDPLPLHTGARAFQSGEVATQSGAILASVAVGDIDHDGVPEVIGADFEGKVYVWNADGTLKWKREANVNFSGKPSVPYQNVRHGERYRTQHGFIGSPVLADLDGDGKMEVIAANMDRHVYAWNSGGSAVAGFPMLVIDRTKISGVDPVTHAPTFNANAGDSLLQGAIVDTPAVGVITGDGKPSILVGTNEEYTANTGNEGPWNASSVNTASFGTLSPVFSAAGQDLANTNGRLFALKAAGEPGPPAPGSNGVYVPGWPAALGIGVPHLLPVVGEGVTGAPVIAPVSSCPNQAAGDRVGVLPNNGVAYIFAGNGQSCYGRDQGKDIALQSDAGASPNQSDHPALAAVGSPAFGNFGGPNPVFFAPLAGVIRALDAAVNEYQTGGQDFVGAWKSEDGNFQPGFPARVNDLQFLTGPSIGNIDGGPTESAVAGTASDDLAAFNPAGAPPSASTWPKFTGDWVIAAPLLGSWDTLDTDPAARKVVVTMTRSGYVLAYNTPAAACSPSSWPRFHHDNANSGNYSRDAVAPGIPYQQVLSPAALTFNAPGDDLLCGTADHYDVVQSDGPIGPADFAGADKLAGAPAPAAAGTQQTLDLSKTTRRYVAVRAVDKQGNVGRPLVVDRVGGTTGTNPQGDNGGPNGPGSSPPGPSSGALPGGAGSFPGVGSGRIPPCLGVRPPVHARSIGPVFIRDTQTRLRRRAGSPQTRTGRAWFYCVRGGGRLVAVFGRSGVDLAVLTGPDRGVRGVRSGTSDRWLRRVYPHLRRLGPGLYAPSRYVVFGVRGHRVTFVAVMSSVLARSPASLRAALRAAGR